MMSRTSSADRAHVAIGARGPASLLMVDASTFTQNFDKAPFLVDHALSDHPSFTMDRLLKLLRSLPESNVEYNAGTLPIGADPDKTPRTGLSSEETIQRIEECNSWMALKNVEIDPEYRDLLSQCMKEIALISEREQPGMQQLEAFIFLSSPGSITPYHMDPEHNFLLQIRGEKEMTLFDRELVDAVELENMFCGGPRNMSYADSYLERSVKFTLHPGKGLHVPVAMPHFVRNGGGVSVSFSITFRTPELYRVGCAHALNAKLRQAGITPAPIGLSSARDTIKSYAWRAWQRAQRHTAHAKRQTYR